MSRLLSKEKRHSQICLQKIPVSFIICCCCILSSVTNMKWFYQHEQLRRIHSTGNLLTTINSSISQEEESIEEHMESSNPITVTTPAAANTTVTTTTSHDQRRACHVVIVNVPDFHHEVIESTALRFPLPFHKFNCTTSKPIIFDFILYNNWFGILDIRAATRGKPKYLNESEFWDWNTYYESYLQYKVFDRMDGTKVFFNRVLKVSDLDENDGIDARIDATCDINRMFIRKMIKDDRLFCVLHGKCDRCKELHHERSCYITPMWPKEQCTFMTIDLPKFNESELVSTNSSGSMKICVFGSNRNHTMLSNLFAQVPYQKYNATFHVGARVTRTLSQVYEASGVDMSKVHIVSEKRYREYYRNVARCNIYLPATEPTEKPSHFPTGIRKLTGSIPQVIAYKLPSVMHMELEKIYHEHLVGPVEVYYDTFESKVKALTRMMDRVSALATET
mmetsp:Transcript_11436/g.21394  ORF Transcript_11436/g.21394 Transcript_11436/m.21394 type:complete len:449 (-) Transcript_11436:534-1880(-)